MSIEALQTDVRNFLNHLQEIQAILETPGKFVPLAMQASQLQTTLDSESDLLLGLRKKVAAVVSPDTSIMAAISTDFKASEAILAALEERQINVMMTMSADLKTDEEKLIEDTLEPEEHYENAGQFVNPLEQDKALINAVKLFSLIPPSSKPFSPEDEALLIKAARELFQSLPGLKADQAKKFFGANEAELVAAVKKLSQSQQLNSVHTTSQTSETQTLSEEEEIALAIELSLRGEGETTTSKPSHEAFVELRDAFAKQQGYLDRLVNLQKNWDISKGHGEVTILSKQVVNMNPQIEQLFNSLDSNAKQLLQEKLSEITQQTFPEGMWRTPLLTWGINQRIPPSDIQKALNAITGISP